MRKLILMTVLSVFSAFAFAQETLASEAATTSATEGTPGPSNAVETAANKFGNWLGRMVQAPVGVAKSLVSGVKSGYSSSPSSQAEAAALESPSETKSAAGEAKGPDASAPSQADIDAKASSLRERFAGVLAMAQGHFLPIKRQAPAPVEDRSVRTAVEGNSLPESSNADKN